MRYLVAFSLAVAFAILAPGLVRAQETLGGVWTGDYSCGGVSGGRITIDLADQADGTVAGTLAFELQGQSGSYHVAGRLAPGGAFNLVPREWIERPTGFTALGAEGRLHPNGRMIEGKLSPCGMGQFMASRAASVATQTQSDAPPVPPSGGPMDGKWQGGIQCRQNRRGATEVYPLQLTIHSDGAGAGGLAEVQIYRKFGSNGGPADTQLSVLSGTIDGRSLSMPRNLPLQQLRQNSNLKELQLELQADGRLTGTTRLPGCDVVELQRVGDPASVSVPAQMAGNWVSRSGVDTRTEVRLHISATGNAFAELNARFPLNQPETARDVLQLVLVPVTVMDKVVLWAPVGYRQATGPFIVGAQRFHIFGAARVFTTALLPDGSLALEAPVQPKAFDLAVTKPDRQAGPNDPRAVLDRSDPGALPQAGTTPPVRFASIIGGTLAAAPTREAQCEIVKSWLDPEIDPADYDRKSLDEVMRMIAPAFDDARFQPVFGLPFLFTTQAERTELARFIDGSCGLDRDMRLIVTVSGRIFRSENGFASFAAILANTAESRIWSQQLAGELQALPPSKDSLERIVELRREMASRRADLTQKAVDDVTAALELREIELRVEMFRIEAEALPATGFHDGALGRVLYLMDSMAQSGLPADRLRPMQEVARQRANAILDQPIAEAAALAPTLTSTLEDLAKGQTTLNALTRYGPAMDRYFGTLDASGRLGVLYARLDEIRTNPEVVAGFAAILNAIEPATGVSPSDRVWQVAEQYITQADLSSAPEMSDLIFQAIDLVELRAVEIVDHSVPVSEYEPSVEDIAAFALQRVRSYNEGMAAQEQACLSGGVRDPVQALICIQTPAVWTGKTGFGAQLLRLVKIGCSEDQPRVQYTCDFTQQIDIRMPGGDAFGASTLGQLARNMSGMSSSQTRFVRNASGGWTGITEISE